MTRLEVRAQNYGSAIAQRLIGAALADLAQRYGGPGDDTPVSPAEFEPPDGTFLVATVDGEPVGCGGWRTREDDRSAAEIKRMFTLPAFRGRGVGRAVLRAIEDSARGAGKRRMVLETGLPQPEAIAFYEHCGYERIANFGHYRNSPLVVSFGRTL